MPFLGWPAPETATYTKLEFIGVNIYCIRMDRFSNCVKDSLRLGSLKSLIFNVFCSDALSSNVWNANEQTYSSGSSF